MGRLAELLDEARAEVREMKVDEARKLLDDCDNKLLLLDIRERQATVLGYIRGAHRSRRPSCRCTPRP